MDGAVSNSETSHWHRSRGRSAMEWLRCARFPCELKMLPFLSYTAKKQAMLRTWQHWLVYVGVQRTKHGMQSVALAFRERSCLRISWAVWRRQHYQKCSGHKMNILALQHWAQGLQFRAWLQWQELYLYTQSDKQKDTRAVTHHQHWELRRCMGAWLGYLDLNRVKKRQNGEGNGDLGQNRAQPLCLGHSDGFFCSRRHCDVSAHQGKDYYTSSFVSSLEWECVDAERLMQRNLPPFCQYPCESFDFTRTLAGNSERFL
uniref:Uncharacterized protein n=1 Tax=Corvus moneduloides TaxID=1196302 RepID=A0A8C3EFU2_CORMO